MGEYRDQLTSESTEKYDETAFQLIDQKPCCLLLAPSRCLLIIP